MDKRAWWFDFGMTIESILGFIMVSAVIAGSFVNLNLMIYLAVPVAGLMAVVWIITVMKMGIKEEEKIPMTLDRRKTVIGGLMTAGLLVLTVIGFLLYWVGTPTGYTP